MNNHKEIYLSRLVNHILIQNQEIKACHLTKKLNSLIFGMIGTDMNANLHISIVKIFSISLRMNF